MTYKPKRNSQTDIYQNNPEKFCSNWKSKLPEWETEYFLKYGKIKNWTKRKLSDVIKFKNNEGIYENIEYNKIQENKNKISNTFDDLEDIRVSFLKYNQININEISNFEEVWYEYFEKYYEIIKEVLLEIWIELPIDVINLKWYIYNWVNLWPIYWFSDGKFREIVLDKNHNSFMVFHELIHHISEKFWNKQRSWYRKDYLFLNEWFTDILAYRANKILTWNNVKIIKSSYAYEVKYIAKLIDYISKDTLESHEYIYKYLARWYFIKWYKWLNIFYKSFWWEFVKKILELNIYEENKSIKYLNKYCTKSFFEKIIQYLTLDIKPSKEVGDIMGIER